MDAFLNWLLKTRMSFYQDDELQLPWWFGLCCWSFAVAGLTMIWTEPDWLVQSPYHTIYRAQAYLLLLVQAPLSCMADYVYMTHDSYWHVLDRCLAVPLMMLELIRFVLQFQESLQNYKSNAAIHPQLCLLHAFGLAFAGASFAQSTQAQTALSREGFIFWHTCWHLYPLVASSIALYDFYSCHGWQRSTRRPSMYRIEMHLIRRGKETKKVD